MRNDICTSKKGTTLDKKPRYNQFFFLECVHVKSFWEKFISNVLPVFQVQYSPNIPIRKANSQRQILLKV
jgi:hypothetical protein